jgi:hypothetical protein
MAPTGILLIGYCDSDYVGDVNPAFDYRLLLQAQRISHVVGIDQASYGRLIDL